MALERSLPASGLTARRDGRSALSRMQPSAKPEPGDAAIRAGYGIGAEDDRLTAAIQHASIIVAIEGQLGRQCDLPRPHLRVQPAVAGRELEPCLRGFAGGR